jgi:hypothetical protein
LRAIIIVERQSGSPSHRAAEQRDELASLHSITSSASKGTYARTRHSPKT